MKIQTNELTFDVTGISRRCFCRLLAAAGVAFVATSVGATRVYAADGSEIGELENSAYTDDELNEGLKEVSLQSTDGILLSMWFNYSGDVADGDSYYNTLCTSTDGVNFEVIGTPYDTSQNPFHDPALFYKGGLFWVISNWQKNDGKFWPMFGYSADLKNWTIPEGGQLINNGNWSGITMNPAPNGNTIVAPDAFVDDDGSVYVVFSAGTYVHYNTSASSMAIYIAKLTQLSANAVSSHTYPSGLAVTAETAQRIDLSPSAQERIDPSLYKQDGVYYLSVKRDGVNNEIWRNSRPAATGWTRVKDGLAMGAEGPSLVKFNSKWRLYTDKISTSNNGQTGIQVCTTDSPSGAWSSVQDVVAVKKPGLALEHLRHGSVIYVTDANALAVVNKVRNSAGWGSNTNSNLMYRLYNPNSGEHFYTSNADERQNLVNVGWNFEGIGWMAPASSNTPVYRMYNEYPSPKTGSGEHHYTTSESERDSLVAAGWKYEGIGWYSADPKSGTPLYRLYNPNEFNNNHHYTANADERNYLINLGWRDEGIAWYGVA